MSRLVIGGVQVELVKKDVKNVHLTVHPPEGRVRIAAPRRMSNDVVRLYAISKLDWIRRQQKGLREQEREPQREYLERESHYVWGRRYLLELVERDAAPAVVLKHRALVISTRSGSDKAARHDVLEQWYREQVRAVAEPLVAKWGRTLGVSVERVFVQRMRTKWGSCNPEAATIRLNTDLARKPRECLEYVVLHELAHLIEPRHNQRFRKLLDANLPHWSQVRRELNQLPLAHSGFDR